MPRWTYIILAVALFVIGRYFYFKPNYVYGQQLPDFNVTLKDGKQLSLSDLEGKYVLIDFWGSWCGPCRKESPEVVKLYKEFHGQAFKDASDFEIFSIAIERNEKRWKRAIGQDGLLWSWHYSSLRNFDDDLAKEFGVRQIPTKFLIDPKGMIVGVNLSFDEIREHLNKERIN